MKHKKIIGLVAIAVLVVFSTALVLVNRASAENKESPTACPCGCNGECKGACGLDSCTCQGTGLETNTNCAGGCQGQCGGTCDAENCNCPS